MADNSIPADIRALSFEQALDELQAIVSKLDQGQGTLDHATRDYPRGAALERNCDPKLPEAQAKIEKLSLPADGTALLTPLVTRLSHPTPGDCPPSRGSTT